VDFSELSFLALKYVAVGAREYGAELTVLHAHAFDLPRYFVRSETSHLLRELSAAKDLCRWMVQSASARCDVETVVRKGAPAEEIIRYAREKHEDIIVLCAYHRTFEESTFFGRTRDLEVRHAPVPVLVVPIFPGS
jgi:nucleotide-binding universal stress UspA family protein